MRINRENNFNQQNIKNNQSFKAHLYLANNFVPYIQKQGARIEHTVGEGTGQKWLSDVWGHIQRLGQEVQGILFEDTPLVLAAKKEAVELVENTLHIFGSEDAFLCMDGKTSLVPAKFLPDIEKYTQPFNFKLMPDGKFVDNLLSHFSQIPREIAIFLKPY